MVELFTTEPLPSGARDDFAKSLQDLIQKDVIPSSMNPPPKYVKFLSPYTQKDYCIYLGRST